MCVFCGGFLCCDVVVGWQFSLCSMLDCLMLNNLFLIVYIGECDWIIGFVYEFCVGLGFFIGVVLFFFKYFLWWWGWMCSLCYKIIYVYKKKLIEDGGRWVLKGWWIDFFIFVKLRVGQLYWVCFSRCV